jgi:hypothetical protein
MNEQFQRRCRKAERALLVVLRVDGLLMLLAAPAVMMPVSCMAWTHHWLGMGALPEAPIVVYLARSLSAMYVMLGAITLYISLDLRRYWSFIRFFMLMGIVFGMVVLIVDVTVHMPMFWTATEGAAIIAVRAAVLYLQHIADRYRVPVA